MKTILGATAIHKLEVIEGKKEEYKVMGKDTKTVLGATKIIRKP